MPSTVSVAIFDFDDTMRRGDSIAALTRYAFRHGRMRCRHAAALCGGMLLYFLRLRDERWAKQQALQFVKAMTAQEQERFFAAFVRDRLIPQLYPEALAEIRRHARNGRPVLIVSASPDCYMRFLSGALPVRAVLATPVDARGGVGANCKGPEKLRRIDQWARENIVAIDWPGSYGYGDSMTDLAYLARVGHPVAVNAVNAGGALRRAVPAITTVTWGKRPGEGT